MSKDKFTKAYDIGYRQPPVHSRFSPGKSGNPAGSSKRIRNRRANPLHGLAKLVGDALNEKISVTVNGKTIAMPRLKAIVLGAVNRAMHYDKSAQLVFGFIDAGSMAVSDEDASGDLRRKIDQMAARWRESQGLEKEE